MKRVEQQDRDIDRSIFENGSTTYYWSAKFFPRKVRDDVFKLYSFVRVVDDFVDQDKPDIKSFKKIVSRWDKLKANLSTPSKKLDDSVIEHVLHNICYIVHRYDCDPAWVDAFLKSMQMDIDTRRYKTLDDTLDYIYGSAEVIGLFMARIMGLPEESYEAAKLQGRAMQYINFIRDIAEDNAFGRQYIPAEDLIMFGLKDMSEAESIKKPAEFRECMEYQITRYHEWQKQAEVGFSYIPKRLRIALRTAVDMYNWTASEIVHEPSVVFVKKVKPTKSRVLRRGIARTVHG
jgi:15-cis-phytoene synthase